MTYQLIKYVCSLLITDFKDGFVSMKTTIVLIIGVGSMPHVTCLPSLGASYLEIDG